MYKKNINHQPKKIIAVVGMAGSGKTEAVKYLEKKLNCPKIYFPQAIFDQLKKEGREFNQANEKKIREKTRQKLGMGAFAILAMPKIRKLLKNNRIIILESLYSWDEYKIIKNKFRADFITLAIYASPAARFSRLSQRPERPIKKYPEFNDRDYKEIEGTDKGGPIAIADATIINQDSLKEFYKNLNKFIKKIKESYAK